MIKIKGEWATKKVWVARENGSWEEVYPGRSQALYNHSSDGFNWGYGGSGPSQLALALALELTDDEEVALAHYQKFKRDVIAKLPQEDFIIWITRGRGKDLGFECKEDSAAAVEEENQG